MDVNYWYQLCLFAAAKNTSDGYISPDDFNNVLMPTAQNSYLEYLKGEYQRYQLQRPIAVVEFSQNQMIRQSVAPLIYETILTPNSTTGIALFPYGYEFTDAMWGQYGFYNIRFVQQDRLSSWYRSSIDPIASNPVYLLKHEGFQFYPENIGNTRLSYVRTPPPIVWGYTLDSNGLPVYNAALSSQPVWGSTDMMQIIVRALSLIGVNLQLGVLSQYAEQIKQGGS